MYTYTIKLVYWQLLLYGVHVGHSFKNSIIFSAWSVYTYRQNILIINLFKTILLFKNGYVGLNGACKFSGPIWFINLNRNVELFINYSAKKCGEFCYSTYWINGLISNWITLANTFRKLNKIISSAHKGQFSKLELDSSPWIFTRLTWPRATFVSSVSTSPHPTKESLYAYVPCLGIVDTDISGHIANIPIPGNDDSLDCVVFYNTHISQYILEKKYGNITGWFMNVRCEKRLINFVDWVFAFYINKKGKLNKTKIIEIERENSDILKNLKKDIKNKFSLSYIWSYGLDFFFSNNFGLTSFKEQVDLFEPNMDKIDISRYFLIQKNYFIYLSKLLNYYILKTSWKFNRYFKKRSISDKLFKLKFMIGFYHSLKDWNNSENYLDKRFFVNKIYKTHLRKSRFRFNKYILKFVKFFYIKKFLYFRGFWKRYSTNILNVSNLAYISMSYNSKLFKNKIFNPILKTNNFFLFFYKKKRINLLSKWFYLKKYIKEKITKILRDKKINKYFKFFLLYKNYRMLKNFFFKKIKFLIFSFKFFFSFWSYNKFLFIKEKKENKSILLYLWKKFKKNEKKIIFIKQIINILKINKYFNNMFDNKELNITKKMINFFFFFKFININYLKSFHRKKNNYIIDQFLTLKRKYKKILRENKTIRYNNKKGWKMFDRKRKFNILNQKVKLIWFYNTYFIFNFNIDNIKINKYYVNKFYKKNININHFNNKIPFLKFNKFLKFYSTYNYNINRLNYYNNNLKLLSEFTFKQFSRNNYYNFISTKKKNLYITPYKNKFIKNLNNLFLNFYYEKKRKKYIDLNIKNIKKNIKLIKIWLLKRKLNINKLLKKKRKKKKNREINLSTSLLNYKKNKYIKYWKYNNNSISLPYYYYIFKRINIFKNKNLTNIKYNNIFNKIYFNNILLKIFIKKKKKTIYFWN